METAKDKFISIIIGHAQLYSIIRQVADLDLTNWYVGAGCLNQTVWNHLSGYGLDHGIDDVDIVYFDPTDLDGSREQYLREKCRQMFFSSPFRMELVNQARVHLWYEKEFGYAIKPYASTEDAIKTWPTTASAVGLRIEPSGEHIVFAPFGLEDLFAMVVRANKVQITRDIYQAKVDKWTKKWPGLTVIPWCE